MKKQPAQPYTLIFWVVMFLLLGSGVFAIGKKQVPEQTVYNDDWLLCVTDFDTSSLPGDKQAVGAVIARTLIDTLKVVSYRLRVSPEYAYYEDYVRSQAIAAAAKDLAKKQDERAALLFQGEADWKYKQNIKKTNADIVKLREELAKVEAEKPLINREPAFGLAQVNKEGNFPQPPIKGGERRFCQGQNADAFLAGTIVEYYNRYFVIIRLFALYTNSFVYEDEIIFSPDGLNGAVDEIAGRLIAALGGTKPAAVAVHANLANALVLINQSFAGRGTVEAHDRPPGKVNVDLSASDFKPETVEGELVPGKLTDINVDLLPQQYAEINIFAPSVEQAAVYQGALYMGQTPLSLRVPLNQFNYISMETSDGQLAKIAFAIPEQNNGPFTFSMKPKATHSLSEQRVEKARSAYYWAWGGTWITGIAAWIVNGMVRSQIDAINNAGVTAANFQGIQDFRDDTMRLQNMSYGFYAVLGAAAAYEIFRMARYIYIATEDSTPIAKPSK